MSKLQEVVRAIKNYRGETNTPKKGLRKPDHPGQEVPGNCLTNSDLADQLGGIHWRSDKARGSRDQRFPQHSIAIIPLIRYGEHKQSGVIIDNTRHWPVIGIVPDINDDQAVKSQLKETYGSGGWRKVDNRINSS